MKHIIVGVQVNIVADPGAGSSNSLVLTAVKSGTTEEKISVINSDSNNYLHAGSLHDVDPDTTTAWDATGLNAAEFGWEQGGSFGFSVTQHYISVLSNRTPATYDVVAESTVTVTSTAGHTWKFVEAESEISVVSTAGGQSSRVDVLAESVVNVTDAATASVGRLVDSSDTIALTEDATCIVSFAVSAPDTIALTETATATKPANLFAIDTISLSETASVDDGTGRAADTVVLSETATATLRSNEVAEDSIVIHEAASYVLISGKVDENYAPSVGGSSDPNAPDPPSTTVPTLTPGSVLLEFPFETPTTSVTLRRPVLGNRDRLSNQRINRTTRGNKLIVFADLQWPKVHTLVMDFSPVGEDDAQDYLDFISTSLGKEVKLTDWEGREWRGLITNPNDPLVRDHRCNLTISLTFEGEPV